MADTASSAPSVTPLEGRTTIDDKARFEPERLSYQAAVHVASKIASAVSAEVKSKTVVIAGEPFLADLGNLASTRLQLKGLRADYDRVLAAVTSPPVADVGPPAAPQSKASTPPEDGIPPLTPLTAGLQAALGLVSLLRQDVDIKGIPTTIDARSFEIALAVALRTGGATAVVVPELTALREPKAGEGSLQALVLSVEEVRQQAWQAVGPLLGRLGAADAALEAATRTGVQADVDRLSRTVFDARRKVEPLSETLGQADRRLNDLRGQWDKANEATGLTMLSRLLRAEAIDGGNPEYLHAVVVASGGHHRVTRNLFRMLFLGDGLSSMGGVVVRWALLDRQGGIRKGGILADRQSANFPEPK